MAIYIKKDWRRYLPSISISISVPYIHIRTEIFTEGVEMFRYTYLGLQWRIIKWEGHILLFDLGTTFIHKYMDESENDILKIDKEGCAYHRKYKCRFYCEKHWKQLKEKNLT